MFQVHHKVCKELVHEGSMTIGEDTVRSKITMHTVVVNHSSGVYVNGAFHTNGIENFWPPFKCGIIGIYHQVSAKHLQACAD
jgi:hypothetical protein